MARTKTETGKLMRVRPLTELSLVSADTEPNNGSDPGPVLTLSTGNTTAALKFRLIPSGHADK